MISALYIRLRLTGAIDNLLFALRLAGSGSYAYAAPAARRSRATGFATEHHRFRASGTPAPLSNRQLGMDALAAASPLLKVVKWGVVGLLAIFAIGLTVFFVGIATTYEPPKSLEAKHLRNARPAITDRDGDLVGAAPGFRSAGANVQDAVSDEARMAALMVHDVPPVWWDVAVALEDRRFGKFGWAYGIDFLSLPNLLLGRRGASTLPMQIVGNLSGDKAQQYGTSDGSVARLVLKVKRKLREFSSAPALVAATKDDDYLWLKRLAATHLPVMHGQIGGSTIGIAGGGWVMFGKAPQELSPGEQAVFAAALKRNITIRKQVDDKVRRDWVYIKQRAKYGLALAYPEGDPRRAEGSAEIDAMPDAPPLFFDQALPLSARAHVVHRRNVTARSVVVEAQAELADRYGLRTLADLPLRGYQLTLNSMDNYQFKLQMDRLAAALTDRLGGECRLFVPLSREGFRDSLYQHVTGKPRCAPADLPKTERAHVLAVLANEHGEIMRFYQSGSEEPIYAGVLGRGTNDGRYRPESEIRDIGSAAKIIAAIALGSEGDAPNRKYCRKRYGERRDSDGTTGFPNCDERGAMIDAREAFARSSNLAILWRLQQLPQGKLKKLVAELGLQLPVDVDAAYAVAFGLVKASPRQIHNLMHATGGIVLERHISRPPHVIRRLDADNHSLPSAPSDVATMRRWASYMATADARHFVREVLGAVLTHPNGTMRFLRPYTPAGSDGTVSAHIGKTGTPVNQNNLVTDKFITGSLVAGGSYFSYLVMVRSQNPAKYPLGQRLSAGDFAPLVAYLLDEIDSLHSALPSRRKLVVKAGGVKDRA